MKVTIGPYKDEEDRVIDVHLDQWDSYSLDETLSHIIHPCLVQLKEVSTGYPAHLTEQEWDEILDKMIYSFEMKSKYFDEMEVCQSKCDDLTSQSCKECVEEVGQKMREGFELFGKYYGDLWW